MKTLFSTKEVAVLMNVTETTVKRWADAGKLGCVKTLGGHRKFTIQEVANFADQHSYPLTGVLTPVMEEGDREMLEFSVQTRNYRKISEILLDEALHGARNRVLELFSYLLKHGITMAVLGDEIVRPAMVEIGELWASGKLEVNEEHIASHALLEAIIRLSSEMPKKAPNGLTALCACAEGEYHEIGLRLMTYALECEGWSITYLGVNTPFHTIQELLKASKPDVLCLSYTLRMPDDRFLEQVRTLGGLAHTQNTTFIVGGFFAGDRQNTDFCSDHIATSAADTIAYLRNRFQLRPGPKKQQTAAVLG